MTPLARLVGYPGGPDVTRNGTLRHKEAGMEMGQWVMPGHCQCPLTHDDEITAEYSWQFFVLSRNQETAHSLN